MCARSLIALALAVGLLGSPTVRGDEKSDKSSAPGPLPIQARLLIPLSGTKTTLRFQVTNIGKHVGVFPPFVNGTKLLVTRPDGKIEEVGCCAENHARDELKSGESKSWDIDVAKQVKLTQKGAYIVAFTVGGVRSNEVLLAVDTPNPGPKADPAARARERAEALLKVLRAKQWDKAAPFVILAADRDDALTRQRMGIAKDATPEEVNARIAAWFKGLYGRGAEIGEIKSVKLGGREGDRALVTYYHEDLDGFSLRRVGDEWYYTLDAKPDR